LFTPPRIQRTSDVTQVCTAASTSHQMDMPKPK
jgi:hypothetical protein